MSEAREFQDGAFYWVRYEDEPWTALRYRVGRGWCSDVTDHGYERPAEPEPDEIGPRIEPPAPANAA